MAGGAGGEIKMEGKIGSGGKGIPAVKLCGGDGGVVKMGGGVGLGGKVGVATIAAGGGGGVVRMAEGVGLGGRERRKACGHGVDAQPSRIGGLTYLVAGRGIASIRPQTVAKSKETVPAAEPLA
jgi:hypothetical protein